MSRLRCPRRRRQKCCCRFPVHRVSEELCQCQHPTPSLHRRSYDVNITIHQLQPTAEQHAAVPISRLICRPTGIARDCMAAHRHSAWLLVHVIKFSRPSHHSENENISTSQIASARIEAKNCSQETVNVFGRNSRTYRPRLLCPRNFSDAYSGVCVASGVQYSIEKRLLLTSFRLNEFQCFLVQLQQHAITSTIHVYDMNVILQTSQNCRSR